MVFTADTEAAVWLPVRRLACTQRHVMVDVGAKE
jgi:hypothetical protein